MRLRSRALRFCRLSDMIALLRKRQIRVEPDASSKHQSRTTAARRQGPTASLPLLLIGAGYFFLSLDPLHNGFGRQLHPEPVRAFQGRLSIDRTPRTNDPPAGKVAGQDHVADEKATEAFRFQRWAGCGGAHATCDQGNARGTR